MALLEDLWFLRGPCDEVVSSGENVAIAGDSSPEDGLQCRPPKRARGTVPAACAWGVRDGSAKVTAEFASRLKGHNMEKGQCRGRASHTKRVQSGELDWPADVCLSAAVPA